MIAIVKTRLPMTTSDLSTVRRPYAVTVFAGVLGMLTLYVTGVAIQ